MPPDQLFTEYPKAAVTPEFEKMLRNGNRLPEKALMAVAESRMFRVYLNNEFWGIYALDHKNRDYKPVKIFGQGNEGQCERF